MKRIFYLMIGAALLLPLSTFAQQKDEKAEPKDIPEGKVSTTNHSIKVEGQVINYTATAGTLQLRDENGEPIALFGYVAYHKQGVTDMTKRPITFAYNGGPGSSSFWLHMGALGPKRVVVTDGGYTPAAPYKLEDNMYTLLDVTDLVMMDPIGTGISKAIGKAKNTDFWGVDQDIRSISLFVKQYITENGRWNSPKYMLGESYGTFRNAGVMNKLFEYGVSLNGVIMISAVFHLNSLFFAPGDDIPYIVYIPTFAATAWYHNKIQNKPANLEQFINDARKFAATEYAQALMKGDQLTGSERDNIITKLSGFTGLSKTYLDKADLRVTQGEFSKELLGEGKETVGRLDSRFKGKSLDPLSQNAFYDPQSVAISPAYTSAFMHYYYDELKVDKNNYYFVSAGERDDFKWDWKHQGNIFWGTSAVVDTGIDMAQTLMFDPNLKVLILNGYFDLATPFYGVEYSIDHLGLPAEAKKNIIMKYYEGGHMMYVNQPSLVKFKKDIGSFITDTSK